MPLPSHIPPLSLALDDLSRTSGGLVEDAKKFEVWSRKLNLMKMWQQYAPCIAIGVMLFLIICYKLFW